jgi:hypothetical protein
MKLRSFLFTLFLIGFSNKAYAEGQDGLVTIIIITYAISICLSTLVIGVIIKILFKSLKIKFVFLIALMIASLMALILGDKSIPFFWFET